MFKKAISSLSLLAILATLVTFAPLAYAQGVTVNVAQTNIGGLNVAIGGSSEKVAEFDVEASDDVWFFNVRVLCVDAKGIKSMRLKYNEETIGSAATKTPIGSISGLEANIYPQQFKLDKNKTYTFSVHANINDDAEPHTTACTIEDASRMKFKDMEDNNIISSRVHGNFGVSEGTYPIYVEPASVVAEKKAVINSNSASSNENVKTEEPKEKQPLPKAGYEDEIFTAFEAYKNPFPDTDTNNLLGKAAAELNRRTIISGFPDGEFKGDEPVNRAQLAKMLLFARYGKVEDLKNEGKFSDVVDGAWYTGSVIDAAEKGIISGYPDKTFQPAKTVNTAEFLKMITLAFGIEENLEHTYTDIGDVWFSPYAGAAATYDMFPDRSNTELQPGKILTRSEVAIAIYKYLKNRL